MYLLWTGDNMKSSIIDKCIKIAYNQHIAKINPKKRLYNRIFNYFLHIDIDKIKLIIL